MATIKIDRGFTQRIQQKDLLHIPDSPHSPSQPPKKTKGIPKRMIIAIVCGVGVLVLLGIFVGTRSKKTLAGTSTLQPVAVENAQQQLAAVTEPVSDEPVEPDDATARDSKKPTITAAPQQALPNQLRQSQQVIVREVPVGSPHGLLCEYYEHIKGGLVRDLRSASTFPGQPSRTVQVGRFELSEGVGEDYGVRVRGYLVPTKSDAYTFIVNVDDGAELWLSTDDNPANIRKLVALTVNTKRKWRERPEQRSAPCDLVEGKRYYIEALMKQSAQGDYLAVGWSVPSTDQIVIIDAPFLTPWTDQPGKEKAAPVVADEAVRSAPERRKAMAAREAALAPATAAIVEQQRVNGAAYRYAEAAQVLKDGKSMWRDPDALALIETAILRFELLGRLRAFVQAELAHAVVKGVWVAFGGQADVTGASAEGVTVAPGRIVAWAKIPPDQMLRLVNATLPKSSVDTSTKSTLFLASAVYCKEINGGLELALKYRERAVSINSSLVSLSDRVLGGSPEAILAQPRIQVARAELGRVAKAAAGLADKLVAFQSDFSSITGLVAGLNVEYWEKVTYRSLDEVSKQGLTAKTPPDSVQRLADFATPQNRGDAYFARLTGFLVPDVTGEYVFYLTADDHGELWLSPDETSDNVVLCLKNESSDVRRQWDKDKRKSKPVSLIKGHKYFVKALLREGSGSDYIAIAWSLVANDTPALITSAHLVCAPSPAWMTSGALELRNKIGEDVQRIQALTSEMGALCGAAEEQEATQAAATTPMANELTKHAERAKEALCEAEKLLQRVEVALPQLKAAMRAA